MVDCAKQRNVCVRSRLKHLLDPQAVAVFATLGVTHFHAYTGQSIPHDIIPRFRLFKMAPTIVT